MNKEVKVNQMLIDEFVNGYASFTGCTSIVSTYPNILNEVGFLSRSTENQARFGIRVSTIISRDPERDYEFYIGDTSLDSKGNFQSDEDMYVFNIRTQIITKLTGNSINKFNPKYVNVHHGDKKDVLYTKLIFLLKQKCQTLKT